jgi:GMP synthase-like glutamine amidotransferase
MRVGLLECDHVADKFRSIAGDYVDMFGALLDTARADVDLVPYDAIAGELPSSPEDCDAYLCTGSRHSVYDDLEWIEPTADFVRKTHAAAVPFVGICFGHQLLAHALGGEVAKASSGWGAGIHAVTITHQAPWMVPSLEVCRLHFMHQDQVQSPPPGAAVLASAEHCPVAMFAVGDRALGIQAHPEFPAAYTDALLADRVARIGEAEVAAARAALGQPTDEATVAEWITAVLAGRSS